MGNDCIQCAAALANGPYCPTCGAAQPFAGGESDPYVGRIIGDRYEVGELISVGGMGRVHRGMQRSLERAVAIKFIHAHLLTSPNAVARFMTEARAASRINHPHVVSIFDFGRTSDAEGGDLFIVMELLAGSDLANVLRRERLLPIERGVEILRQTLLALAEAHHMGITHRDVKPENVVLERFRGDVDHVKVIDFGIASVAGRKRITRAGELMGTPAYMAPEQVMGEAGPSADLYAVGVMLFELLTGCLLFDHPSAQRVFQQHLSAPRPDPREVSPHRRIPAALARVCLRALEIDAARRFPDAESFAAALVEAARPEQGAARGLAATVVSSSAGAFAEVSSTAATLADAAPALHAAPARPLPGGRDPARLVGRLEELAWAREQLEAAPTVAGVALWGRHGVGRTRLARELLAALERRGCCALRVEVAPAPHGEVGFASLRAVIASLVGRAPGDRALASGGATDDPRARAGLRAVFAVGDPRARLAGTDAHASVTALAVAALRWAVRTAVARASGARVVMLVDDADAMDRSSLAALRMFVRDEPLERFALVLTSERRPDPALLERLPARCVHGLRAAEAARLWAELGGTAPWTLRGEVEPLYVEHLRRWREAEGDALAPPTLGELLELRVQNLEPAARRVLQAVAVAGGASTERLARMTAVPGDLDAALGPLEAAGFVARRAGVIVASHALVGQTVLHMSPHGTVAELHVAAADSLADAPEALELRAYHAVRGRADFEAFVLVEEAARLRAARGDAEGAAAVLADAVHAARIQATRGDADLAASACAVFGAKLSSALIALGRVDEAHGLLAEVLDFAGQRDLSRALILEQLAIVAAHRGRDAEADRRWREARVIAEHRADRALAERLRRPVPTLALGAPQPRMFVPGSA